MACMIQQISSSDGTQTLSVLSSEWWFVNHKACYTSRSRNATNLQLYRRIEGNDGFVLSITIRLATNQVGSLSVSFQIISNCMLLIYEYILNWKVCSWASLTVSNARRRLVSTVMDSISQMRVYFCTSCTTGTHSILPINILNNKSFRLYIWRWVLKPGYISYLIIQLIYLSGSISLI